MLEWLQDRQTFRVTDRITCVSSGHVGDLTVNCYKAFDLGFQAYESLIGKSYDKRTFSRKSKVINMSTAASCVKRKDKKVSINHTLIFQRMCMLKRTKEDLIHFLSYELAPYPVSLFFDFVF